MGENCDEKIARARILLPEDRHGHGDDKMTPYVPPEFHASAFNCPHCNVYAKQTWQMMLCSPKGEFFHQLERAVCTYCDTYTLWHNEQMIYPEDAGVQPPNVDLPEDIKADYLEAKAIVNKSLRGAAALLRLCIEKLCRHLGEKGNINSDIANLVKRGLPPNIQQALDVVRVIGNNAVHPGEIDLKDDRATAIMLFGLTNMVAEVMLTQPKQVDKLYESLPRQHKEAIRKRDKAE